MTFVINNFEKVIPFIGNNDLRGSSFLFELLNALQNRTLSLRAKSCFNFWWVWGNEAFYFSKINHLPSLVCHTTTFYRLSLKISGGDIVNQDRFRAVSAILSVFQHFKYYFSDFPWNIILATRENIIHRVW